MLTKEYLDQLDFSTLYLIAADRFRLELHRYENENRLIDCDRLIADVLEQQEKVVRSLPTGLLEEAIAKSNELREEVYILKKDSTYEVVSNKNLGNYGYSLMFPNGFNLPRNNPGWTIVLEVGEQYDED